MPKRANFVFFDGARTFGLVNGVVNVEVVGNVLRGSGKNRLDVEVVEVAQLRCSVPAAKSLIQALQMAIGEAEGAASEPPRPNVN